MATKAIVCVSGGSASATHVCGVGSIITCATTTFADELIATRNWVAYASAIHTTANGAYQRAQRLAAFNSTALRLTS